MAVHDLLSLASPARRRPDSARLFAADRASDGSAPVSALGTASSSTAAYLNLAERDRGPRNAAPGYACALFPGLRSRVRGDTRPDIGVAERRRAIGRRRRGI